MSVPIDITDDTLASSLVPVQCASVAPPAKFYVYSDVTHTKKHTHTPLVQPALGVSSQAWMNWGSGPPAVTKPGEQCFVRT